MIIVEVRSYAVGNYAVWQRPRNDNPGFAQYLVYLGERLIGKQFSLPDAEACRWLEHHQDGKYATSSRPQRRWTTAKAR